MPRFDLAGRTIAITGSTGGLGTALALALRQKGAQLALFDLDGATVRVQAAALGNDTSARGWSVDVRSLDSIDTAMTAAATHFGGIDVVIANAGITTMAPMASLDPAAFERVIDINLTGVWRTFRAALPHIMRSKGHLLATSSLAAFVHSPLQSPYTATKAGVWAMCDSIRLEVRPLGVTVGTIHPTFFQTPMMEEVLDDDAGKLVWGGNTNPLWKTVPIDDVVTSIVRGIERRRKIIVIPPRNTIVALAPGLVRPFIERIGFNDARIVAAITAASSTGWNHSAVSPQGPDHQSSTSPSNSVL